MHYIYYTNSPLGTLKLASNKTHLIGLWFLDAEGVHAPLTGPSRRERTRVIRQALDWLDQYFAGQMPDFLPPIEVEARPFVQEVCQLLLEIPYGERVTYGDLAKKLAEKRGQGEMSAQAIGTALGENPIALLIPCHRVIRANGEIGNYAGGIKRKAWLLHWEASHRLDSSHHLD